MSTPKVILAPCVEGELWAIGEFIAKDNSDAASRVIESAYETFTALAATPMMGKQQKFLNPKLKGIRTAHIDGFDNYLIFYRIIPDGIQVLHVYHGARNIEALLHSRS